MRTVMDLPEWANIASLWPEWWRMEATMPSPLEGQPAWALLESYSTDGLLGQLTKLLEELGSSLPEVNHDSITVDESDGIVHIHPQAIIEPGSHFIGPCFVGEGAKVRHGAYLRQGSWIAELAKVGHASEIKHSLLMPRSQAPHFNYIGDSLVGYGANLGAGVKLSNLRHDDGPVRVKFGDELIPSGLRKFGALIGSGVKLGCNTVTNPGTILGQGCMSSPNTTITGAHPPESILR